jgi:hypothetical protein
MPLKQHKQVSQAAAPAGSIDIQQPRQQQPKQQLPQQPQPLQSNVLKHQQQQQGASSCYSKVSSWLNSTGSSSRPGTSRAAGPLLSRATSLLWYIGLGGMLYPRATAVTSSSSRASGASRGLQRQAQAAAGAAASSETTAATAAAAPAPAAPAAAAAAGPPGHPKPMLPTGPHYTTKAFPASHPLQAEQAAGISTSASAGAAATAPVQAVAKGELPVCECVLERGLLILAYQAAAAGQKFRTRLGSPAL